MRFEVSVTISLASSNAPLSVAEPDNFSTEIAGIYRFQAHFRAISTENSSSSASLKVPFKPLMNHSTMTSNLVALTENCSFFDVKSAALLIFLRMPLTPLEDVLEYAEPDYLREPGLSTRVSDPGSPSLGERGSGAGIGIR